MEELRVGDRVWVKESKDAKGHEGIVIRKASEPQAYWVEVNGRFLRRTRVHLRKLEREDLQEGLNEREEVSWEPERMEYWEEDGEVETRSTVESEEEEEASGSGSQSENEEGEEEGREGEEENEGNEE